MQESLKNKTISKSLVETQPVFWIEWTDNHGKLQKLSDIFSFKLMHRQGRFARVRFAVAANSAWPPAGRLLRLLFDARSRSVRSQGIADELPVVIMHGYLRSAPRKRDGLLVQLEITAESPESADKLEAFLVQHAHDVDRLFCADPQTQSVWERAIDYLEPRAAFLHWHRVTGDLSLSTVMPKHAALEEVSNTVIDTFDRNSLVQHHNDDPLQTVMVQVEAEWLQRAVGTADIAPIIAQKFPNGIMSTLTGHTFVKQWPRAGGHWGHNGYRVVHASLREIVPEDIIHHDPVKLHLEDGQIAYGVQRFYQGSLWVSWRYYQRRHEAVRFNLGCTRENPSSLAPTRRLTFRLQNIAHSEDYDVWGPHARYDVGNRVVHDRRRWVCQTTHRADDTFNNDMWHDEGPWTDALEHPGSATFFSTARGHQAIGYALDIAYSHWLFRARANHVSLRLSLDKAVQIHLHDWVTIIDPHLSGGRVIGQVIAQTFIANGPLGEFYGTLTVASFAETALSLESSAADDKPNPGVDKLKAPFSGLKFSAPSSALPPPGLQEPCKLTAAEIVESISLTNLPEDQSAKLLDLEHAAGAATQYILRGLSTTIGVRFRSLKGCDVLHHTMTVQVDNPEHPSLVADNSSCRSQWSVDYATSF